MTRLALGTVQFGLAYGVTNPSGQVPVEESGRILAHAATQGISLLDTAAAYGQSETVLAELLAPGHSFRVVTKTLPLAGRPVADGLATLNEALDRSLRLLAADKPLYGLMVHHAGDLLSTLGSELFARLEALQRDGKVEKIGVSVYAAEELEALLDRYPLDLVQLPHNILDQRLRQSGWLARLSERNVEIHVRSAFLQGLLLQSPDHLPSHLSALSQPLRRVGERADKLGVTPMTLALAYLRQQTQIAEVVVGVLNAAQLDEIARAWELAAELPAGCADDLGINDPDLLNPARWPHLETKA